MKSNRENGSAILSCLANLAGKGKYAQLEAENMAMKQQVTLLPEKIAQGVAERAAKLEKAYERERRIAVLRLDEYTRGRQEVHNVASNCAEYKRLEQNKIVHSYREIER